MHGLHGAVRAEELVQSRLGALERELPDEELRLLSIFVDKLREAEESLSK